jgi:LysM repeat protein
MTRLISQTGCFELAKAAGFSNANAEIAAAIAMAETNSFSGGKAYADFDKVGDISLVTAVWGPSYGGWQVRSLVAERGKGTFRDALWLPIPENNAAAAYSIWKTAGERFTPWSTFTSKAYLGFMQAARYNPVPVVPPGTYLVSGGDTLSKIGLTTKYPWQLIAAVNRVKSPYTIYPGQTILLPDWPYTVRTGDTLTQIAKEYSEVTPQRLAEYNHETLPDVNRLFIGQLLKIPRYTSWDGRTLVL